MKIDSISLVVGKFYFLASGITHSIVSGADNRFIYFIAKPFNQTIDQRGPYVY